MANCLEKASSPSPPYPRRRGNHLPRLAEAAAGPEDVVLVLITVSVLIGSGSSASAVLRDGGVDLFIEKEKTRQ